MIFKYKKGNPVQIINSVWINQVCIGERFISTDEDFIVLDKEVVKNYHPAFLNLQEIKIGKEIIPIFYR